MSTEKSENIISIDPPPSITWKVRLLTAIDLFSFLPVPKTDKVSSNISLVGSLTMIVIFIFYMIYSFSTFLINNAPRVNDYSTSIKNQTILLPDIAFGFFYGEPFNRTINDPNIFTFTMYQVRKYYQLSKQDNRTKIPLIECQPTWIPDQGFPMLCPQNKSYMGGALYQTNIYDYPVIYIELCKGSTCVDNVQLQQYIQGGRVLLFIKNDAPNLDLTTGDPEQIQPYRALQYFLVDGLFMRSMLQFQVSNFLVQPDYLRRWSDQSSWYVTLSTSKDWTTNVSYYSTQKAFQLTFNVDQELRKVNLVYSTVLDQISKWGAFWGVLFAVFASIFLRYNATRFYQDNDLWDNFEMRIGVKRISEDLRNKMLHEKDNNGKINRSKEIEMNTTDLEDSSDRSQFDTQKQPKDHKHHQMTL